MNLPDTKKLLSYPLEEAEPRNILRDVLRASIELLSIEGNDFTWSSWKDSSAALAEVSQLLAIAEAGGTPDRIELAAIFAPTGPMQEVSVSSGWGEAFLKVAARYDYAAKGIWG